MNSEQQAHSYEELREAVVAVLANAEFNGARRFETLLEETAREFSRPDRPETFGPDSVHGAVVPICPDDADLVLEIVWDLFRQGIVTFGANAANPGWPWLRLTRFGECALRQGVYRLHNKAEFMKAVRAEALDVSSDAVAYLREAVAAFYTDCLLSACVMLGLAAESEFLRLLEAAKGSRTYGRHFARIDDGLSVRAKILRFGEAIRPVLGALPDSAMSDLDDALTAMQSILRAARNESGAPSNLEPPTRDQVYVYLQLFIPFAEQMTRLRRELTEADYRRLANAP